MGIDTDTFFLTAAFHTDALKEQVEELKEELEKLEGQYVQAHTDYINVMADLQKMEEKANFARSQLEKNMAIFAPPAKDDVEKAFDELEHKVINPMSDASLYGGAAATLVWAVGAGGKALKMRKLAKFQTMSELAKAKKTARWTKVAKFGKASGALAGVVFLVETGLRMRSASEINAHFKQKAGEMRTQLATAEGEVADLQGVVADATAMRDGALQESGFSTIDEYVRGLNESIAELGRQRGSLGSARRMLIGGMSVEDVEMIVPGLPPESLAALARKLAVERALLDGVAIDQVAANTGATVVQVKALERLQFARLALLDGADVDAVVASSGLSLGVVEGEDETLESDLRLAWSMLAKNMPPDAIAARCLFSVDTLSALEREHDAKEQLHAGKDAAQVASDFGVPTEITGRWRDQLDDALVKARVLIGGSGPVPRLNDIAADLRVPIAILQQLTV